MSEPLPVVHPHAAGIDIGTEKIFVSTPAHAVRSVASFTSDLRALAASLRAEGITTAAMEATGIYWVPIYDMLVEVGIDVYLVNSKHVKHVPGRKSDVRDCQWLQQLHSLGLLRRSFVPEEQIRTLRHYQRLREDHIRSSSMHIHHIHKALDAMNVKVHTVISDVTGASGLRIIRAILAGEQRPEALVALCDRQILAAKRDRVIASLEGNYKPEYLFALRQALELWEFYQDKIHECDLEIDRHLTEVTKDIPPASPSTPRKPMRHHAPAITDLGDKLLRMSGGVDPTVLPAITDHGLLKIFSEIGTDMSRWPTVKHFTAWLGLAPGKHSSGKHLAYARVRTHNHAGAIFRQAAMVIAKSKHLALGGFYRRIRSKAGARVANVATARKLAVLYYNLMTKGVQYVELGLEQYEQQQLERRMKALNKSARTLGYTLTPVTTT